MPSNGRVIVVLCALFVLPAVLALSRANRQGWFYSNGSAMSYERRVNIICQMLITGSVVAAAAHVRCSRQTVYKYWKMWQTTGSVEPVKERPGPAPVLTPSALLYLYCLSEINRSYQLVEYQERLKRDIGVDASERVICAALKRLGQHRKQRTLKKIEAQTPHARLLRQRYRMVVLTNRIARGPAALHDYVFIDEM